MSLGPSASPSTGVIPRLDLRGRHLTLRELRAALPRAEFDVEAALDAVRPIVASVRTDGAAAVYDAAERFDGIRPERLRVPAAVLSDALDRLDPAVRAALEESIRRARLVHADQRRADTTTTVTVPPSLTLRDELDGAAHVAPAGGAGFSVVYSVSRMP